MVAVIIAGGKGTRLGLNNIPKPMVRINNTPLLVYQITKLKKYGINKIFLMTGYLSEYIETYFKNNKIDDIDIECIKEDSPLGTAGGIKKIEDKITNDFVILYGDIVFDINFNKLIEYHKKLHSTITIVAHPNDHPYDSDLIKIDKNNKVISFIYKPHDNVEDQNIVNSGIYISSKEIFKYIDANKNQDFCLDVFNKIDNIFVYKSAEYIKDIGTKNRLDDVETDEKNGKISRLNCENKRKAIFLDRDGTINKLHGHISSPDDLILLDNVSESIQKINNSEYLAILITNQPGIAKGFFTHEDLKKVHNRMEFILGKNHAYLNDIYYCPHHQDSGFDGEVKELKIKCDCRKPNNGMILKAAADYNIDLRNSWMIGDSYIDLLTGIKSGCRNILIYNGNTILSSISKNLEEAVNKVIGV